MACVLCGKDSGKYFMCFRCNKLKDEGKVLKCSDCGKWYYVDKGCTCKTESTPNEQKIINELSQVKLGIQCLKLLLLKLP